MDTHLVFLFPIWNIFEVSAGCGVRLYVFSVSSPKKTASPYWVNGQTSTKGRTCSLK